MIEAFQRLLRLLDRCEHPWPALAYFSFTVLTTLGFGDILPVSPWARSLVTCEVLSGQLYLAAFVARLVGVMRAGPRGETRSDDEALGDTA